MELPVPPYPPPPRHVPEGLGRRAIGRNQRRWSSLLLLAAGVFSFVLCPMLFAAGGMLCLLAEDFHVALLAAGFLVFATLSLVSLKSLLPRRWQAPAAVLALPVQDEPVAHAFVHQVAGDLGCSTPKSITLGSGVELALIGRRSLFGLIRPGRSQLIVGLWLWNTLTLSEFQAVVARTLAPFSRGRLDGRRHVLGELLRLLLDGNDFIDEMAESENSFSGLARWLRKVHLIVTYPQRAIGRILFRLAKRNEDALSDDLAAVCLAGSDSLVHAVLRADFAGATLHQADEFLKREARCGIFTVDLYAHSLDASTALWEAHNDFTLGQTPSLRSPNAGKYADVFEPGQTYLSTMWVGLPSPLEREQSAKRTFVASERDDRPASILLADSQKWRGELTRLRYLDVLQTAEDSIFVPSEVVSRWIAENGKLDLPSRYEGCYDDSRAIDTGTSEQRNTALTSEESDDVRLLYTAEKLYNQAGERAARLKSARTALAKIMRRTLFRPTGRDRALADELEDDIRKLSRWLAALDRWGYTVHLQMAARLPDLSLHETLLARYESVLRFQAVPTDARTYLDRLAAFVRKLEEDDGLAPGGLIREAKKEFKASRRDFEILLGEIAEIDDRFLLELTGGVPLKQFLYAHGELPSRNRVASRANRQRLLQAWEELLAKSRWLHDHGVMELLRLHEQIRTQFSELAGELPSNYEPILLEPLHPNDELTPIDLDPDIIEIEVVDEI